jgi:hypothetical protein
MICRNLHFSFNQSSSVSVFFRTSQHFEGDHTHMLRRLCMAFLKGCFFSASKQFLSSTGIRSSPLGPLISALDERTLVELRNCFDVDISPSDLFFVWMEPEPLWGTVGCGSRPRLRKIVTDRDSAVRICDKFYPAAQSHTDLELQ